MAWRAHKPLPWALRSSAALALGLAMPRAPATELVFWHRVSDCAPKGCGLLFSFLFLFYLFALSAFACCSEVTVTRFHSPRLCRVAVFLKFPCHTSQRLSQHRVIKIIINNITPSLREKKTLCFLIQTNVSLLPRFAVWNSSSSSS